MVSRTKPTRLPRVGRPRGLLALLPLLSAGSLFAQSYAVDWSAIGAGGGTSDGGSYALSGTLGQLDAVVLGGGHYRVEGGFWPGVIATPTTGAPTLLIQLLGDQVQVSWLPATPGFRLEQTGDLAAPSWTAAPAGNPVLIRLSGQAQFYRLSLAGYTTGAGGAAPTPPD